MGVVTQIVDVDKSDWGDGPWQTEADTYKWTDNATGYRCIIHRGPLGAFCGYVGVPETHCEYETLAQNANYTVHGGITYSHNANYPISFVSAHAVKPNGLHIWIHDRHWYLGFDCSHGWDYLPKMHYLAAQLDFGYGFTDKTSYKTADYVKREIESLAMQMMIKDSYHGNE